MYVLIVQSSVPIFWWRNQFFLFWPTIFELFLCETNTEPIVQFYPNLPKKIRIQPDTELDLPHEPKRFFFLRWPRRPGRLDGFSPLSSSHNATNINIFILLQVAKCWLVEGFILDFWKRRHQNKNANATFWNQWIVIFVR